MKFLGLTAELVSENLGVGAGRRGVLADDDLFVGALDHGGEGGSAGVVESAFGIEGGLAHATTVTKKRNRVTLFTQSLLTPVPPTTGHPYYRSPLLPVTPVTGNPCDR
ncbi:hypothetical protein GCM10010431_09650 [Streptomyces kunmingensis]